MLLVDPVAYHEAVPRITLNHVILVQEASVAISKPKAEVVLYATHCSLKNQVWAMPKIWCAKVNGKTLGKLVYRDNLVVSASSNKHVLSSKSSVHK